MAHIQGEAQRWTVFLFFLGMKHILYMSHFLKKNTELWEQDPSGKM